MKISRARGSSPHCRRSAAWALIGCARAPAHQLREAVRVETELAARERPLVARLRHAPIRAGRRAFTPLLQVIYNVRVLGDGDDAYVFLEAEVRPSCAAQLSKKSR